MESPDDKYLWEAEREEPFPEISILQGFLGIIKLLFFLPFTLALIPIFLLFKYLYYKAGIKVPMLLIRKFWSRVALKLCGLQLFVNGQCFSRVCIVVSNHVSWLDILAIQSVTDVIFVAKSEVQTWPGLGFLAQLADTLFVERKPQKIGFHSKEAEEIMSTGESICFFPEGTSSDGLRVLKFRSGFFQLAYGNGTEQKSRVTYIQPLSLFYKPKGNDKSVDFYGWWGSMSLLSHMIKILCKSSGSITLKFHEQLRSDNFRTRKHLAGQAEKIIGDEIARNVRLYESRVT